MKHSWHDISSGPNIPQCVNAIIEVPKGSKNKYELDKESGHLRLDRVLYSSVQYPANYGFIPQTYCEDDDPLDILVLGQDPVTPLCIMQAIPIGVMLMQDQGEKDSKIISVHANDPEYKDYVSINELPQHRLREVERFFQDYKILENKEVIIEKFLGAEEAKKIIMESIEYYKKKFKALG